MLNLTQAQSTNGFPSFVVCAMHGVCCFWLCFAAEKCEDEEELKMNTYFYIK